MRALVRVDKGIAILSDLLNLDNSKIVYTTVLCIRNLIIDARNKEMFGKYCLKQLGDKLPLHDADLHPAPSTQAQGAANASQAGAQGANSSQGGTLREPLWVRGVNQETLAAILAAIFSFIEVPKGQIIQQFRRTKSLPRRLSMRATNRGEQKNPTRANPEFARYQNFSRAPVKYKF